MEKVGISGYMVCWIDEDGYDCAREFDCFHDSTEKNFVAMRNFAEMLKRSGVEDIIIEETQRILVEGINC